METLEIESMKRELIEHINNNFPEDKRDSAIEQISSMNESEFIEFLKTNNLIKDSEKCVFCSIIFKEIPSTQIAENEKAIAILEINPISEGHTIIIPKSHLTKIEEIDSSTKKFAEKIKNLIEKKLNPKKVELFYSEAFGHQIINILPVYSDETQNSKRTKSNSEELEKTKNKILEKDLKENEKQVIEEISKKEILDSSKIKVPKRFP
jgi:histidine triad (HIT) family protein